MHSYPAGKLRQHTPTDVSGKSIINYQAKSYKISTNEAINGTTYQFITLWL